MNLRMILYNALVNRHPGIGMRYHRVHDKAAAPWERACSWLYLLWLNFCYYFLFCRFLDRLPDMTGPRKPLPVNESESGLFLRRHPEVCRESLLGRLAAYDVISFDLFDTLILRPMDEPADLFFLLGERTGILNFKEKRRRAEGRARALRLAAQGDAEVTLSEIWEQLSAETGIPVCEGMRLEEETEEKLCFADPLLLAVWRELRRLGRRLVVTTDMYLPEEVLERLLQKNGFDGYERLLVSGVLRKSKADGSLYEELKKAFPGASIIHVGDHPGSDVRMAKKHGLDVCYIPNVHAAGENFRTGDLSAIVGSAWRGIVNAGLYRSAQAFSRDYEFGFVCGGLFVLGYCGFIHESVHRRQTDRILFLSRDGDTLKRVYDRLYPGEDTVYCYWSRRAAAKLSAGLDREDYFSRFLYQKMNLGIALRDILGAMELEGIAGLLLGEEIGEQTPDPKAGDGRSAQNTSPDCRHCDHPSADLRLAGADILTDRNAELVRSAIEQHWEAVLEVYRGQREAAARYIRSLVGDCERAVAVDVGWAGSGAMSLSRLAECEWKLPCELRGIVAGTNTPFNTEPDTAEPFLLSGKLEAYLYSQRHNRDLWRRHDPAAGFNLFFELLLSSDTPRLDGFYPGNCRVGAEDVYDGSLDVTLRFGERERNEEGIREIRRGILDFTERYTEAFREYPYMLHISGRDAYGPLLAAASHGERYLRALIRDFDLRVQV